MTREEVRRLLALEPLVSSPDLLDALWKAGGELIEAGAQIEGDGYCILEGIENIGGIWRDLQAYGSGEGVDLISRITVFSDSGEVASWFAEMASHGRARLSLYREAAMILLALHGLMALAAETQAEEADEDLDNDGGAGMSDDLMFLRLFNEFAAANPRAADEWLFAEGRSGFTWSVDEERMVFQPQDDAAQVPVDDLPFMDDPFFIGADMASGPDATVTARAIAKVPSRPNRLSVIRISFFVMCQDCLRLSIYSREKHGEQEFCQCGGQWCGCESCNEQALMLLSGERDQNKLGLQVPISSWSPVNGCVVVGGAA